MSLKLKRLSSFSGRRGPLLLIIMDGIGLGRQDESNAVYLARTPNLDRLFTSRFFIKLKAHGTAVGLVNRALESGRIFQTEIWSNMIERVQRGGTIHFIGLLSDGNVHSHIDQLFRMIDRCAEIGAERLRVHPLLDGRDAQRRRQARLSHCLGRGTDESNHGQV